MKQNLKTVLPLLLILLLASSGFAQRSKESLEKQIKSLQTEIATANKLLKETSKNKEVTLNQVSIMEKKIKNRQKLINVYSDQIAVLEKNINKGEQNIRSLNNELAKLRQEYSKMVSFAYKNRSYYDQMEFLFAAEDFNQAMRRLRYIQQFTDARKTKIDQIAATQQKVSEEVESQRKNREEQLALLADQKEQQKELIKEKSDLNAQVAQLKKKEGSIKKTIKDKQAQAKKFQKEIDNIIAEEIRKANERAAKEAKKSKTALTPSEKILSTSFSANKGNLPWPVEKGVVSSSFGKHNHPVSKKVTVTNNGINISTSENTRVRCVFDGEVVSVVRPSASNMGIIIRHGDYFTVYSQLDEVYVNRGDKVKTKQEIGKVHTDRTEGKTELYFEMRHGKDCLNPSGWLAR